MSGHRNPTMPEQYIGADDVGDTDIMVRLDGIAQREGCPPIVGIYIDKLGPAPFTADAPDLVNLFSYWPATPDMEEDWRIDDAFHSLPELCEQWGLPLADVIDRICIELLRLVQKSERKGRRR